MAKYRIVYDPRLASSPYYIEKRGWLGIGWWYVCFDDGGGFCRTAEEALDRIEDIHRGKRIVKYVEVSH